MRRKILLSAAAFTVCLAAGPAAASIVVLGSSHGRACYEAARDHSAAAEALLQCDLALASGMLTPREIVATHVNRGIVKLWRGEHESAIADFDHAIALDPNEPESYLNKGSAILRMDGSASAAVPLFTEALERRTRRPELAYYGRAIAHEVSGNIRAAYNDYRSAQQAAPKWRQPAMQLTRFQVRRAGGSF